MTNPTPQPSPRCPTCHSARKDVRQLLPHPTEDAHCFDSWHSTRVAEEKPRPALTELLEKARTHTMTPEEKEAQRQSWVRGEMAMSEVTQGEQERAARFVDAEITRHRFRAGEMELQENIESNDHFAAELVRGVQAMNAARATISVCVDGEVWDVTAVLRTGTPSSDPKSSAAGETNAGAPTGEGVQNEADTSVSTGNSFADNSNRGHGGPTVQPLAVVPSGGAQQARQWRETNVNCTPENPHAIFGLWTDKDVAEYAASGGAPEPCPLCNSQQTHLHPSVTGNAMWGAQPMSAEQFNQNFVPDPNDKQPRYVQVLEAYAASSNAQLKKEFSEADDENIELHNIITQMHEEAMTAKSKVSTLKGELREARQEIAELKLRLGGGNAK